VMMTGTCDSWYCSEVLKKLILRCAMRVWHKNVSHPCVCSTLIFTCLHPAGRADRNPSLLLCSITCGSGLLCTAVKLNETKQETKGNKRQRKLKREQPHHQCLVVLCSHRCSCHRTTIQVYATITTFTL
jgi:hypothetical protein